MRLLLVRHGETVDNVAGNYAGTTDSPLTNHGALQANRLGLHLCAIDIKISHIFSSDLQRAFKTAEAIRATQSHGSESVIQLALLREQDFGFYEGKKFFERSKDSSRSGKAHLEAHKNDLGFQDVESKQSMRKRVDAFIDQHLIGHLKQVPDKQTVVVVAHGIILSHLWGAFLNRFQPGTVTMAPGVGDAGRGTVLEYLGGWSNTGYLDLEIKPVQNIESTKSEACYSTGTSASSEPPAHPENTSIKAVAAYAVGPQTSVPVSSTTETQIIPAQAPEPLTPKLLDVTIVVKAVNSLEHLKGLKKTRGGIGSLKHDSNQKTMDSFFKKRRLG